jgi:diacylglycerol O-acyltransferase
MPAPWAPREQPVRPAHDSVGSAFLPGVLARGALHAALDVVGVVPALASTVRRGLNEQSAAVSFSAPRMMFNVPITGARRFAAQSWPIERIRRIGKAADATVNDVVLALCSGALRTYLLELDELPDSPLIAMVPVSLHADRTSSADGGGNAVGAVMCNLGTHLSEPADRLASVHRSMIDGKQSLKGMTRLQILAMTAVGMGPLVLVPLLGLTNTVRPPFNLIISNVPGPRRPLYWNGARLDGLYPLSIPLDGQALNITVTSYSEEIAFGLTGCRRTVPHLQRLLAHLDSELDALERAVAA